MQPAPRSSVGSCSASIEGTDVGASIQPARPFQAPAPDIALPATAAPTLVYRFATDADRDGIERLNHAAFADELGQHAPTPSGRLPDRFAAEMTYAVAVDASAGESGDGFGDDAPRVVGMIGLTDRRPFSLDRKLAAAGTDLDAHLPPHRRGICEVRLLAIDAERRGGTVLRGLVACAAEWCLGRGADLVVISGTTRQLHLYRHLGFEAFGPVVGTAAVPYQPMFLTLDRFRPVAATFAARVETGIEDGDERTAPRVPSRFLPGPVALRPAVRAAFAEAPVSHRSAAFRADLAEVRRRLRALTGAAHVAVLVGTGTLANDVVGGQIRRLGTPGVVLACGAFGERLAAQAARWGLPHRVARRAWGETFRRADLDAALDGLAPGGWVWTPLCETSTGVLLDLGILRDACAARGLHLALDAVSAIGSVPVDFADVWMASGTSGKGLGALAGLALVFHREAVAPAPDLPAYLDLGLYAHDSSGDIGGGVAFTHASPLVRALGAALATAPADACARLATDAATLRAALRAVGLPPLACDAIANPAVTTVVLPPGVSADAAGRAMRHAGFEIACESAYLQERGWVQVCLMGAYDRTRLPALAAALARSVATLAGGSGGWDGVPGA